MKKEQFTIRTLPIVRLGLEKNLQKTNHKNLNDYINFILESHLYKLNQEENITESINGNIKELEEKLEKTLRQTAIELEWNKKLLAKVCANFNVSTERN